MMTYKSHSVGRAVFMKAKPSLDKSFDTEQSFLDSKIHQNAFLAASTPVKNNSSKILFVNSFSFY